MADEEPPIESTGTVDESALVPVERDRRFLFRLVALMLVGVLAAAFVGAKIKGWAGSCGAGMIRPGTSVIPPDRRR